MSRQYFDFSGLIDAYSTTFTVITHEKGEYNSAGDYVEEHEKRQEFTGAIIAYRESKVFRSDGAITAKDKRLYMQERLPAALIGAEVVHGGQRYMIESELENAEFTGIWAYHMKWVSAFD